MTKKEILFLLAPCILFVWMATLSFSHADDCYPDQKVQQLMGERNEMLRKLKSGELQATPEQLLGLVGESYRREHQIHQPDDPRQPRDEDARDRSCAGDFPPGPSHSRQAEIARHEAARHKQ